MQLLNLRNGLLDYFLIMTLTLRLLYGEFMVYMLKRRFQMITRLIQQLQVLAKV